MREIGWIKYLVSCAHWDLKAEILVYEQSVSDYLLYFRGNRIGSNGGCCLTHVNTRCLGDFAEISWLQVGFEQMWVVEKANWNWHLIRQLGSVLTSRPQYECGKSSAAQYGNKMSAFVYLYLFFPLLFGSLAGFVDVSRYSKYCHLWSWRNLFWAANRRHFISK